MSARFRTDSKGRSHYILHQEMNQSCGPACIAMAESLYKLQCMIDPERRARLISQEYPGSFTEAGGTRADNLAYVLNRIGVKAYGGTDVTTGKLFDYFWQYIGDRTPIIAHISWQNGGGHFTLLRQIDADHRLIFLDPWYDIVEVPRSQLPTYNVPGGSGTFSGWLTITHR